MHDPNAYPNPPNQLMDAGFAGVVIWEPPPILPQTCAGLGAHHTCSLPVLVVSKNIWMKKNDNEK